MNKYNVPIIATSVAIIENRLSKGNSLILNIPNDKLLIECIKFFFDEIIKENNESRIKLLEKELNYFCTHSDTEQFSFDLDLKETRTIEEVPFDKPKQYNFDKGKKKDKVEVDMFLEMFGYEDEIAIKEKEEKIKKENKTNKTAKQKKEKVLEEKKIKPEVIQEQLNAKDIEYCEYLKKRFIFIDYQFERLYNSVYLIALFKENNGNKLVLIKFNNNYLLTNDWYLKLYKGENGYESMFSSS